VAIGIGLAMIVVAVVGGTNLFHYFAAPLAFETGGAGDQVGIAIDQTTDFGSGITASPRNATVTIDSIKPIITKNTSKTTVNVVVCGTSAGLDPAIGITPDEQILNHCDSLAPVEGATIHFAPNANNIIVRFTPHAYGDLQISGFEVRYRSGMWHQTQTVGGSFNLTTP
jgi:hypothetical protein